MNLLRNLNFEKLTLIIINFIFVSHKYSYKQHNNISNKFIIIIGF